MNRFLSGIVLGLGLTVGAQSAQAILAEIEPNNDFETAQDIENFFVLSNDSSIQDAATIPHVAIAGTGDGTDDYYTFLVHTAGGRGLFDIDGTTPGIDLLLALTLLDASGNVITLAVNDDSAVPDPGSTNPLDPFLITTFPNAGRYYLIVTQGGTKIGQGVPPDTVYRLNISVEGHPLTGQDFPNGVIPEPASAALVLMGMASLATVLRRRR